MEHATVKVGDMEIPLIGISKKETQDVCDFCGVYFHLQDLKLSFDGEFLCENCYYE